jgi:predicted RNase H-like HicB family nuclease
MGGWLYDVKKGMAKPELPGCSAFGDTEEDAIKEVKIAASLWLDRYWMKGGNK